MKCSLGCVLQVLQRFFFLDLGGYIKTFLYFFWFSWLPPKTPTSYGWFHPGRKRLLKNVTISFYGKIVTSQNKSIDGLQPTCRYQLRVSRDPHNFSLGHALSKMLGEFGRIIEMCTNCPSSPSWCIQVDCDRSIPIFSDIQILLLTKIAQFPRSSMVGEWFFKKQAIFSTAKFILNLI